MKEEKEEAKKGGDEEYGKKVPKMEAGDGFVASTTNIISVKCEQDEVG